MIALLCLFLVLITRQWWWVALALVWYVGYYAWLEPVKNEPSKYATPFKRYRTRGGPLKRMYLSEPLPQEVPFPQGTYVRLSDDSYEWRER